jgi:hypothetical protein
MNYLNKLMLNLEDTEAEAIRELATEYAKYQIERLLHHLSTSTSDESWTFSMDLGGATESGFAWAKNDIDWQGEEPLSYIVDEGKDIASLLNHLLFDFNEEKEWEKHFIKDEESRYDDMHCNFDLHIDSD